MHVSKLSEICDTGAYAAQCCVCVMLTQQNNCVIRAYNFISTLALCMCYVNSVKCHVYSVKYVMRASF